MFYRMWAFCARRETTYNNQLRILIGLERNSQQMRWLFGNEIPPCCLYYFLRANGAERRSGRKPGARVLIPPDYLHPGKRKH
jgi:hypothetical protein